jgi:hypothetical protein
MNDDQQQLEQATSLTATGRPLDEETAELREGWQTLGELLEAAYPAEETALVTLPAEVVEAPTRRHRGWSVALSVAASLAVVIGGAWYLDGQSGIESQRQIAKTGTEQQPLAPLTASRVDASNELVWNDTLDEEIALVGDDVAWFQQRESDVDDELASVVHRVDEIDEALADDSF